MLERNCYSVQQRIRAARRAIGQEIKLADPDPELLKSALSGLGKQFLPACHLEDSVGQLLESVQIGDGINRSLDVGVGLSKSPASQSLQDPLRFLLRVRSFLRIFW